MSDFARDELLDLVEQWFWGSNSDDALIHPIEFDALAVIRQMITEATDDKE